MHSPHVNLHRPFGDVSGLERHGSAEDEVPCVSHCGQQTFLGHNESTLTQHNLCGSSRAVVNNSDCHSGFWKGKTTSLVLHPVRDMTPYSGGTTGGNPAHGFQIYDNTSFQAKGFIPYNIEPSCLAYTETASTYSLGGHTEQQQRNVGGGEGNSHYANEMCYLYSDDASFDLESPVATHETSDAQGMYYSPMPLPMNEHLSHSRNAQENDQGAATSSSMLQPEMPDPAVVTNVADSSAYRGEDQHLRFQTGAGRPQQNSRRRTSNHASTTTVNGEGLTPAYIDIGDANWRCHWCGAAFWFGERLKSSRGSRIRYGRCCGEGKVVEHLIQILDTHNELVALFRTARDICNENDVPNFTVRLYNVDGARQYEVPSTDILGAIVFESGPETNTEYDVIIQKKGERPQRINKLHSTYMAL
ncbi:helitron helicase-like domain-containing protein [Artemisia annua]|uniref:Helitron helicase-like domain-containing protein n=1 Tax=Artemisia annua TaxID=35608 RepID=A0A2U1KRN7_ARTAN|nr:helitron helicase-like domain-containing protein [Artemisia annua]